MQISSPIRTVTVSFALGFAALVSCKDPMHFDASVQDAGARESDAEEPPENCPASEEWLPAAGPLAQFEPLPHPSTECPFYRGGWQNFLVATQPDADGEPTFRSYATLDDLFVSKKPHAVRNTAQRAWLGDIKQAGGRQILVDQNGHAIYYGIHVNQGFADFVNGNDLRTLEAIQNANPKLFFPAGVVEFKSAWQDIDEASPADYSNYITTSAWVPHLVQDPNSHQIIEDKNNPRMIKVALLALHVVFTLPGHPEFVWATFEHVDATGTPDVAPAAKLNPPLNDPYNLTNTNVVCQTSSALCKGGTPANKGNQALTDAELRLDEATQSFKGQQTSIYRMFPGAKSNGIEGDEAIGSLNANMRALFAKKAGTLSRADKRMNYALVGAVWMDKPAMFKIDSPIQNDQTSPLLQMVDQPDISGNDDRKDLLAKSVSPAQDLLENGSDSPFSILAGEDRLSSVALESFTQSPAAFPNCFSCHNTEAITARGVPVDKDGTTRKLLDPKLINVSHVFSQFVLEETQ